MPLITLAGGGEPPVWISTRWSNLRRCSAGAEVSKLRTVAAPHICVTPCSSIIEKISAGSILRRQMWVPPIATTDHGKHQPLQRNSGKLQGETGLGGRRQGKIFPEDSRNVPRW